MKEKKRRFRQSYQKNPKGSDGSTGREAENVVNVYKYREKGRKTREKGGHHGRSIRLGEGKKKERGCLSEVGVWQRELGISWEPCHVYVSHGRERERGKKKKDP